MDADLKQFLARGFLPTSATKDVIRRKLKQICAELNKLEDEHVEALSSDLTELSKVLSKPHLTRNPSKEVQILTGCALIEIFRLQENPFDFNEKTRKNVLKFFISQCEFIADSNNPNYPLYFHLLEILAATSAFLLIYQFSDAAVLFEKLFSVLLNLKRDTMIPQVTAYITDIMREIIEEPDMELPHSVLCVVFEKLIDFSSEESRKTAAFCRNLIVLTENALENRIFDYVNSVKTSDSEDEEDVDMDDYYYKKFSNPAEYIRLIYELSLIAPSAIACLLPKIQAFLVVENRKKRLFNVKLISGLMLADERDDRPQEYVQEALLARSIDVDALIRLEVVKFIRELVKKYPEFVQTTNDMLTQRVIDTDERVRREAVMAICEVIKGNSESFPESCLTAVLKRIFDTKESVRAAALTQLSSIFRMYGLRADEGSALPELNERFAAISRSFGEMFAVSNFDISVQIKEIFDLKILGEKKSVRDRAALFLQMYSSWTSKVRENVIFKLVLEKKRLQTPFSVLLHAWIEKKIGEGSEILEKLFATVAHKTIRKGLDNVETRERLEQIFQCKNRKVQKWLGTIINPQSPLEETRVAQSEVVRSFAGDVKVKEYCSSLLVKLGNFVFCGDFVKEIFGFSCALIQEGRRKDVGLIGLLICSKVSNVFVGIMDFSFASLIELLRLEDDDVTVIVLEILAHITPREQSKSSDVLEDRLLHYCCTTNVVIARHSVKALLKSLPNASRKLEQTLASQMESLDRRNPQLATVLAAFAEVLKYDPRIIVAHSGELLRFVEKELLSDFSDVDETAAKSMGIDVLVNYVYSVVDNQSDFSSCAVSTLRVLTSALDLIGEQEFDAEMRDQLVLHCLGGLLRLSCIRKFESRYLSAEDFGRIAYFANGSSDNVKTALIESIFAMIVNQGLSLRFCVIFALVALESAELLNLGKKFLKLVLRRQRLVNNEFLAKATEQTLQLQFLPEYHLSHLVHLLAHHPSFDGSLSTCRTLIPCVELYISCLLDGQQSNNFSLISVILDSIRGTEDVLGETKKVYIIAEMASQVLAKCYVGKEWKAVEYPRQIVLPSGCYAPKEDHSVDVVRMLPANFVSGKSESKAKKRARSTKTRSAKTKSKKRPPRQVRRSSRAKKAVDYGEVSGSEDSDETGEEEEDLEDIENKGQQRSLPRPNASFEGILVCVTHVDDLRYREKRTLMVEI